MRGAMMRGAWLLAIGALVCGCTLLAPVPDRSRFFTLPIPPGQPAERPETSAASPVAGIGVLYGLGPITLPAYLDRREVVTRVSPTEVAYSETDRWAEPLTAGVASVLSESLSAALGTNEVVLYPWVATLKVDYQIRIRMQRFERDASGVVQLAAEWSIRDVRLGREVAAKDTLLTRPATPDDTEAAAAALSATLSDLGHEIAVALRALPSPRATPAPERLRN